MDQTAPASELERRKQVRICLRGDLNIEPQKYEGRTYYVVKDPVSLRYYRLKDNEHFLLQFLDGKHTLEDAQKAYEKQYRPDRLRLEDLEGFAQQLLNAGLAQSDSPRAGKQLFDRRKKRRRSEWMQALTNILYIKIPVFDPEKLLGRMLRYLSWIFSGWFFALSVGVMLAAVLLVATHFETFRQKLPNYHEFFSFKTVAWLWLALGVVKVIHEFGHGLSCKVFGGEVHEMGALFLVFSPALYCNVSDAWTLPNKWHRIIISAAGIYVELIIAALATFVWWNTPSQPFLNNLSLSLMIVCSVSTVVFNANPLMRYDGYYVLADWLEIPNLRERSNRFLKNLMLEHCLGVEVIPEGYMALWRRVLFVAYAVTSYIYRWVITFAILWFMYNFLRPYKLEVISSFLTLAAAGSMVGWPMYRLGKNIHRRGRLPDMKRWRVLLSGSALAALILFVFLVPVPVSRVRGVGLVEPGPGAESKVFIRHPGILKELNVRVGQEVREGQILAVLSSRERDIELAEARAERDVHKQYFQSLQSKQTQNLPAPELDKHNAEKAEVRGKYLEAETKFRSLQQTMENELTLRAPQDGVVGQAPRVDDVGKLFDPKDATGPFLTIIKPGRLRVCLPVVTSEFNRLKEDLLRPSDKAEATHRLLQRKRVTVNYKETPLAAVFTDLGEKVKGLHLRLGPRANLSSETLPVTYQAEKAPVAAVLDGLLEKYGLGYVVYSEEGNEFDGWVDVEAGQAGPATLVGLDVDLRVHGRDAHVWKGRIAGLPEQDAKVIPLALSSRAGGPVAVKAGGRPDVQVPQTQHYLVYVEITNPDPAILPGTMAQVKIHCRPETCAQWLWRKVNDLFDLGLI